MLALTSTTVQLLSRCSLQLRHYAKHLSRTVLRELSAEEELTLPVVAIVGRPNVGKSALFNRLVKKRDALVYDTPQGHVTRDYKEGVGHLSDLSFKVLDTSGLEPFMSPASIQGRATAITAKALRGADITMLLIDAKAGILPADEELVRWLKKVLPAAQPLLLLANKAENQRAREGMSATVADAWRLAVGEPVAVSATSGEGMVDLYHALQPHVDAAIEAKRQYLLQQRKKPIAQQQQQQQQQVDTSGVDGQRLASTSGVGDRTGGGGAEEVGREVQGSAAVSRRGWEAAGSSSSSGGQSMEASSSGGRSESDDGSEMSSSMGLSAAGGLGDIRVSVDEGGALETAGDDGRVELEMGGTSEEQEEEEEGASGFGEPPIRVAVMGLPNVGKSTLVNQLLEHERCLTGPEPGLTRDAVRVMWVGGGGAVELVDTAGWMRSSKLEQYDEEGGEVAAMTLQEGERALQRVHVVVLVLDALRCLQLDKVMTRKELVLAGQALEEGKALVLVLNKMDALPPAQQKSLPTRVVEVLEQHFTTAGKVPCVVMSALQGQNTAALMPSVVAAYDRWNRRVSTGTMNFFLRDLKDGLAGGGATEAEVSRVKYITQVKARPPTFAAFVSGSETRNISDEAAQFLASSIRKQVGFEGVPLRLLFRYNKRPGQQAAPQRHGMTKRAAAPAASLPRSPPRPQRKGAAPSRR